MSAITQIAEEKGISKEIVLDTVATAIAAAYRKDFGQKEQLVTATIDPKTEKVRIFIVHKIVEEVEDPIREVSLEDAKKTDPEAQIDGEIREEVFPPAEYGRVAAQTAKQVILQRLREAERDVIFQEYKSKEGEIISGTIQRIEGDVVMVDIGKASGILFPSEQSRSDHYYVGQRVKVYVVEVQTSGKDPQVVVSRAHPEMIRKLFETEVPEITGGTVEIKAIAREAGVRSKVAVISHQESIDPVGSLVGRRGVRVQAVMAEIGDEKIDIVLWDPDPKLFITNALAPAKVREVEIKEAERMAKIRVDSDQLSLAIGKAGQNVRLASKLTGYQIEVDKEGMPPIVLEETKPEISETEIGSTNTDSYNVVITETDQLVGSNQEDQEPKVDAQSESAGDSATETEENTENPES
ncbi:transcription termination factor NusA [Patescibacteria group bacterium]|nr:transcription termination factor NusA [Patescibacteria group bacterium]